MSFPENVVKQAWGKAGGHCQCRRKRHKHRYTRCNKQLTWSNRGRTGRGAWEAHHKVHNRGNGLSNCEILCWDCHSKTL